MITATEARKIQEEVVKSEEVIIQQNINDDMSRIEEGIISAANTGDCMVCFSNEDFALDVSKATGSWDDASILTQYGERLRCPLTAFGYTVSPTSQGMQVAW